MTSTFHFYGFPELRDPPASMSESTAHAIAHMAASSKTSHRRDQAAQTVLIRSARTPEERAWILHVLMVARDQWRTWLIQTQRKWQASVSRRPQRNRNHDSWTMRENYLRCRNG